MKTLQEFLTAVASGTAADLAKAQLIVAVICVLGMFAFGQTKSPTLSNPGGNVDFSKSPSTRPVKLNSGVPKTCMAGELLIDSKAPAGQNLFSCGGNPLQFMLVGGASVVPASNGTVAGQVTVKLAGKVIGTEPSVSFQSGLGVILSVTDANGTVILQPDVDTAFVLTRSMDQAGTDHYCIAKNDGNDNYTCSLMPMLTGYTPGMPVTLTVDTGCTGSRPATLNINGLGAEPLRLADGVSEVGSVNCQAGAMIQAIVDAKKVFRIVSAPVTAQKLQ